MKPVWQYIIIGIFAVLILTSFVLSYISGQSDKADIVCNGIKIEILDSCQNRFIDDKSLNSYIDREYGEYIGVKADSINLSRIEEIVERKTAIYNGEAFITKDGNLHIEVTQKTPAVRFQGRSDSYYADQDGNVFPLQRTYTSYVPIIDGAIPARNDSIRVRSLTRFMMNFENDKVWKGKIVQIHIDPQGNMTLYPREGREKFLFGQMNNVEEKIEKMHKYYTNILPKKGKDYYKTVDLKYADQIVCKVSD